MLIVRWVRPYPVSLTERYRPHSPAKFVGLNKPKLICAKLAAHPFDSAWLFIGPSGTGKTTMGMALAEMIPAELHHIPSQSCDLATLERTSRTCNYVPMMGKRMHLVLVDEADRMSEAAQLFLLSKLDGTADGVLVDCGCFMWREQRIVDLIGFVYPVAMTAAAYGSITQGCKVGSNENKAALAGCLSSLWLAIKRSEVSGDVIHFTCEPVYSPGSRIALWSKCGPGDDANPVLTIMLEGED